jgi:hypothetical protein
MEGDSSGERMSQESLRPKDTNQLFPSLLFSSLCGALCPNIKAKHHGCCGWIPNDDAYTRALFL